MSFGTKATWWRASPGRAVALAIALLIIGLALDSYSLLPTQTASRARAFKDRLHEALARGDSVVRISSLATFPWERVCIVTPYALPELHGSDERKALAAKGAISAWWVGSETSWGLVFSGGAQEPSLLHLHTSDLLPVSASSLGLLQGEGEPEADKAGADCLGKDEASFVIVKRNGRFYGHFTRF